MNAETTCMRHVISVPMNEYKILVSKFLEAICAASRQPAFCPRNEIETLDELFQKILEKDQEVSLAVEKLCKHQEAQRVIQNFQDKIARKDRAILNYAAKLREAELVTETLGPLVICDDVAFLQNIARVLRKHNFQLNAVKNKETIKINPRDITAYAHKISGTTSAPSYWRPGFPMFGFSPPAPQEQMMRAGVLSRGIIEEVVLMDDTKRNDSGEAKSKGESQVPDDSNVPLGISIPDMDIAKMMPLGWKPGDPIVLPTGSQVDQSAKKSPGGVKRQNPIDVDDDEPSSKRRKVDTDEDDSDSDSSDSDSDDDAKPTVSLSLSSGEDSD